LSKLNVSQATKIISKYQRSIDIIGLMYSIYNFVLANCFQFIIEVLRRTKIGKIFRNTARINCKNARRLAGSFLQSAKKRSDAVGKTHHSHYCIL
jgi:hypothetical protein